MTLITIIFMMGKHIRNIKMQRFCKGKTHNWY